MLDLDSHELRLKALLDKYFNNLNLTTSEKKELASDEITVEWLCDSMGKLLEFDKLEDKLILWEEIC